MPLYRAEVVQQQITLRKPRLHDKSQVLYLPFDKDDGSYARDRSGYNNHGVIYGASWVDGKYGKALSFNGVDNYVEVASNSIFNLQEMTISSWFNANDVSKTEILIGKDITGNYNWEFYRNYFWTVGELGCIYYYLKTDATVGYVAPTAIFNVGQWYHTVFIFKPNGYYEMWVNGNRVRYNTAANFSSWRISTTYIMLGTYYNGSIDEVRIYNRALSQAEIQHIMNMRGI
jgi:hypothetical protein